MKDKADKSLAQEFFFLMYHLYLLKSRNILPIMGKGQNPVQHTCKMCHLQVCCMFKCAYNPKLNMSFLQQTVTAMLSPSKLSHTAISES